MIIDSKGWVKVPKRFGIEPKQEVYLYLDFYTKVKDGEPVPRIELAPTTVKDENGQVIPIEPDEEKKLLGTIKLNARGQVCVKKIIPYAYGTWQRVDNYYLYIEEKRVFIEKET